MLNHAVFIGRLTDDINLVQTANAGVLTHFSLAVPRRGKSEQTDFIPCVAFNKTAEFMNNWLHKGSRVAIEGHFQSSKYTNKENKTIYKLECIVDTFQNLDPKERKSSQTESLQTKENDSWEDDVPLDISGEDLPF